MTALFDRAIAVFGQLPPETQNDFARLMIELARGALTSPNADEAMAIAEAEAELSRGERVPPEVIRSFWRRFGL